MILKNLNLKYIKNEVSDVTQFHNQILEKWFSVYSFQPETMQEILTQYLAYNQHLKIKNKVIKGYIGNNNINDIRILDILDKSTGNFQTLNEINAKLNMNLTQFNLNSITSAIKPLWRKRIRGKKILTKDYADINLNESYIKIGCKLKHLSKVSTREIYNTLIESVIKTPTAVEKWINMYPFLENYDWTLIFQIPFRIIKEPYLQSFQYKIVNRILNCKENLFKWKLNENNTCQLCNEVDTIEHHLVNCSASKVIWDKLKRWLFSNINIKFMFTECEIIFSLPFIKEAETELINFVIIITKWYINNAKSNDKPLYFIELLRVIEDKIRPITYANKENNRINTGWQNKLYDIFN